MTKSTLDEIKSLDLFKDIQAASIESLVNRTVCIKLRKGQQLFQENEKVDTIYILLFGKTTMYRSTEEGQKRVVFILNSGELLNEVIFDYNPASISCEAFEDCTLLSINRDEFLKILEKDFELTKRVMDSMAKKIRRLYRQLKNTVPIKMDKKVAAKLWKLSKDYGIERDDGILINLNMTVTYLADMLGSSRETISRALKQLENEGLIMYENKKIIARSRDELSKYFRGM